MSFGSVGEFLAMGGHGLYVWMSYTAALAVVLYNVISVRHETRRFLREARDRQRRHGAAQAPFPNDPTAPQSDMNSR